MNAFVLAVFIAIHAIVVLSALWDWKNDPPKSGGGLDGGGEGGGFFDGGHGGGHGDCGGGGGHH